MNSEPTLIVTSLLSPEQQDKIRELFRRHSKFKPIVVLEHGEQLEVVTEARIQVGDWVIYDGAGVDEKGLVVDTWIDENGDQDCYVAFWGDEWPWEMEAKTPRPRPGLLRYHAQSLKKVIPSGP